MIGQMLITCNYSDIKYMWLVDYQMHVRLVGYEKSYTGKYFQNHQHKHEDVQLMTIP